MSNAKNKRGLPKTPSKGKKTDVVESEVKLSNDWEKPVTFIEFLLVSFLILIDIQIGIHYKNVYGSDIIDFGTFLSSTIFFIAPLGKTLVLRVCFLYSQIADSLFMKMVWRSGIIIVFFGFIVFDTVVGEQSVHLNDDRAVASNQSIDRKVRIEWDKFEATKAKKMAFYGNANDGMKAQIKASIAEEKANTSLRVEQIKSGTVVMVRDKELKDKGTSGLMIILTVISIFGVFYHASLIRGLKETSTVKSKVIVRGASTVESKEDVANKQQNKAEANANIVKDDAELAAKRKSDQKTSTTQSGGRKKAFTSSKTNDADNTSTLGDIANKGKNRGIEADYQKELAKMPKDKVEPEKNGLVLRRHYEMGTDFNKRTTVELIRDGRVVKTLFVSDWLTPEYMMANNNDPKMSEVKYMAAKYIEGDRYAYLTEDEKRQRDDKIKAKIKAKVSKNNMAEKQGAVLEMIEQANINRAAPISSTITCHNCHQELEKKRQATFGHKGCNAELKKACHDVGFSNQYDEILG